PRSHEPGDGRSWRHYRARANGDVGCFADAGRHQGPAHAATRSRAHSEGTTRHHRSVKSAARSVLTTERRLGAGATLRTGTRAAYRAVAEGSGEPHSVRTELATGDATRKAEAIACSAHITDLHV